MRRPHHREKSHLFWKLLGTVGVVNLIAWPVLIHVGRLEDDQRPSTVIPPRLMPPAQSAASGHLSALPRIISPPHANLTAALPAPAHPKRLATVPRLNAKKATPELAAIHRAADPARSASTSDSHKTLSTDHTPPHPVQVARNERTTTAVRPTPPPAQHRTPSSPSMPVKVNQSEVVAARLARAKQLEAEGRLVAEQIAREREARTAALPSSMPVSEGPSPVVAGETAVGAGETTAKLPIDVLVPSPRVPAFPKVRPRVRPDYRPALVVWKAYPVVPDRMMTSSWHATFRGQFTVHGDGTASARMVSSTGFPMLDQAAMEAARRWKFRPARRGGKTVVGTLPFVFNYDVHPVR